MFSKRNKLASFISSLTLISLSSVMFLLTACGQLIGEQPPRIVTTDAKIGFETKCLQNALPVIKGFLDGSASESDVRTTWQCFGNGVRAFQRKVKGTNQDFYYATEIVKFFDAYFFSGIQLGKHPELITEIMHVKQIFIGGSVETITREELGRLVNFAGQMEQISVNLLPYMKVYAKEWSIEPAQLFERDADYFERANLALQQAAKDLGAIIEQNDRGYKLTNFVVLMSEMAKLYNEKWDWLDQVEKVMPLVEKLKGSMAGGDPSTIAPNEWRRFSLIGGRGFIQYLRYYYFVKKVDDINSNHLVYWSNSLEDILSYFADLVKGKQNGTFTKQEMLDIVDTVKKIFPNVKISEEFVTELMKLKKMFFGGSAEIWIPSDFATAQGKVQKVRSIAEHFLNYVEVYLLRWHSQDLSDAKAQEFFGNAENNFNEIAQLVGSLSESDYELSDLVKLSSGFDELFPGQEGQPLLSDQVKKYLPLMVTAKNIILADEGSLVPKSKWIAFLSNGAKSYSRVLYWKYFLAKTNLQYGTGLHSLDRFVRKTGEFISELILQRPAPSQNIKYAELDHFLSALASADLWMDGLLPETAQSLLRVVFERVLLEPERRLNQEKPDGLRTDAVAFLQVEYNLWSANQHLIEVLYQSPDQELSAEEILANLKQAAVTDGTKELIEVFSSPLTLSVRDDGLLSIKNLPTLYRLNSTSKMNLARVAARIILRSYGMDLDRIKNLAGINLAEVDVLFKELRPLIVELGLIEPNNVSFARNRFYEANLFTPTADGNDLVNFREGSHLAIMILSGLELNRHVEKMIREGCEIKLGGISYRDTTTVECAAQVYYLHRDVIYDSMPDMRNYLLSLDEAKFKEMFVDLLKAAGWKSNDQGTLKIGELGLVPHVYQYEEMLMQRFDVDAKDGVLTDSEAVRALPTYGPLIGQVSPIQVKEINDSIFFYLIKYGSIPSTFEDMVVLFREFIYRQAGTPLEIHTDRALLAKVFGAIADAIRNSQTGRAAMMSEAVKTLKK